MSSYQCEPLYFCFTCYVLCKLIILIIFINYFRSKKQLQETTSAVTFPSLSPDDEANDKANQEAIAVLKKLPDYTLETAETGNFFADLIIKESEEFSNRTFTTLLSDLPWTEKLLTQRVEDTFYHGKHMTLCRLYNNTLAMVSNLYERYN